jgi:hypothetical protein
MKMRQAALALACGCIVFAALGAVAQTSDRIVVPFSDPSKPGAVKINLLSGSITVTGYPGKEVLVVPSPGDEEDEEYTPRPPQPPRPPQAHKGRTPAPEAEREEDPDDRARGLHRVPNLSSGLTIDEQNNVVVISSEAWGNGVDLNVQVPVGTALDLATVNDGDIVVRNVDGEINAENTNGEVTLRDVSGSVVAHALNGDVVVTLQRIDPKARHVVLVDERRHRRDPAARHQGRRPDQVGQRRDLHRLRLAAGRPHRIEPVRRQGQAVQEQASLHL